MTASPRNEYVCTLSKELLEKAEVELNENPQRRSKDIKLLRDMVLQYPGLHIRTDDAFLLRFLRARKFDIEKSFQLILNHYKMKVKHEDIFKDLRPSSVKHMLNEGVDGVLPDRDKLGRKVLLVRPGKWDPSKYSIDGIFRSHFLTLSKLIQDEETQINGFITLLDIRDFGLQHMLHFTPSVARRYAALTQDAFPARFKGMHYINQSPVLEYAFAVLKFFLKEKTVKRSYFHGVNMKELTEFIDEEYLPEEYGGKQPPYSNKDWADALLQCDAEFDEEAKYGLVNLGSQQTSKEDAIEGTVGSFKKLDV